MANSITLAPHSSPQVTAIMRSNLPPEHKVSQIRDFYNKVMATTERQVTTITMTDEVAELARADLMASAVGLAHGWIESKFGSWDVKGVPVDGMIATGAAFAAVGLRGLGLDLATEARNASAALTAIATARKSKAHFDAHKGAPTAHGEGTKAKSGLEAWAENL